MGNPHHYEMYFVTYEEWLQFAEWRCRLSRTIVDAVWKLLSQQSERLRLVPKQGVEQENPSFGLESLMEIGAAHFVSLEADPVIRQLLTVFVEDLVVRHIGYVVAGLELDYPHDLAG